MKQYFGQTVSLFTADNMLYTGILCAINEYDKSITLSHVYHMISDHNMNVLNQPKSIPYQTFYESNIRTIWWILLDGRRFEITNDILTPLRMSQANLILNQPYINMNIQTQQQQQPQTLYPQTLYPQTIYPYQTIQQQAQTQIQPQTQPQPLDYQQFAPAYNTTQSQASYPYQPQTYFFPTTPYNNNPTLSSNHLPLPTHYPSNNQSSSYNTQQTALQYAPESYVPLVNHPEQVAVKQEKSTFTTTNFNAINTEIVVDQKAEESKTLASTDNSNSNRAWKSYAIRDDGAQSKITPSLKAGERREREEEEGEKRVHCQIVEVLQDDNKQQNAECLDLSSQKQLYDYHVYRLLADIKSIREYIERPQLEADEYNRYKTHLETLRAKKAFYDDWWKSIRTNTNDNNHNV